MEKFLRSNNLARVIAILLALILWLFVTGDKITRTTPTRITFEVPLQVEGLAQDHIITDMQSTVDIMLEGLPEYFVDLTLEEIYVFVDLNGLDAGNHLIRVQDRPPRGLGTVLLEPEQVRVSIESYISEDFELEIELIGEAADGWNLTEYSLEPDTVFIGAPESVFEKVARMVLLIDITGMRLIESIELTPVAYDEEGNRVNGLVIDPSLITVRLEFERIVEPEPLENGE
ncbi:MAG: YbbR-like domain-containing protein [Dethiobacteria bacterium]|nr:hypothetical protein [Bacillota bacterium]MDW7729478.1 CdaR family protein [Bacillota bacterium]